MKTYGPYTRADGRKQIVIQREDGSKTTRSYPRLLLEQKLGRALTEEETVDHIDGDFTNDSFDNLRPLTLAENAAHSWVTGNSRSRPVSNQTKKVLSEKLSGVGNPRSTFTLEQIRDIRSRAQYRGCIGNWAKEFSVSYKTMQNILDLRSYKTS